MKQDVTFCDFCDRFRDMGRNDQFTYEGKRALYDWLIEYEESCAMETELDVIGLCCEYSEHATALEAAREYGNDWTPSMYDEDDNERDPEEIAEELETYCVGWLQERTQVIVFDGGVIIAGF